MSSSFTRCLCLCIIIVVLKLEHFSDLVDLLLLHSLLSLPLDQEVVDVPQVRCQSVKCVITPLAVQYSMHLELSFLHPVIRPMQFLVLQSDVLLKLGYLILIFLLCLLELDLV